MYVHFVIRRAESLVACESSVLRAINLFAQMLDSRADRERLCFNRKLLFVQHFKRISRAVTDGKDNAVGFDNVSLAVGFNDRGGYFAVS